MPVTLGQILPRGQYIFLIEFADDLITVDERCIGCGGLVHTSKLTAFMALKVLAVIVLRMSSASGW